MSWDITEFYKEGSYYRGPEKQLELAVYGFYPRGLGDLIYNTLRKIIETNDKSPWAYTAFSNCSELLYQGKRWPDCVNPLVIEGKEPYRSQYSMTRDPWVTLYACAVHLNRKQYIQYAKPPLKLYSPEVWAWRRALLGKRNLYRLWRWMSPARKDYVKVLDNLMWNAYKQNKLLKR